MIIQCFTNGTVNLKYGVTEISYNICHINPYKLDTKVEDFNLKICLTVSTYNHQLYTYVYTLKLGY